MSIPPLLSLQRNILIFSPYPQRGCGLERAFPERTRKLFYPLAFFPNSVPPLTPFPNVRRAELSRCSYACPRFFFSIKGSEMLILFHAVVPPSPRGGSGVVLFLSHSPPFTIVSRHRISPLPCLQGVPLGWPHNFQYVFPFPRSPAQSPCPSTVVSQSRSSVVGYGGASDVRR